MGNTPGGESGVDGPELESQAQPLRAADPGNPLGTASFGGSSGTSSTRFGGGRGSPPPPSFRNPPQVSANRGGLNDSAGRGYRSDRPGSFGRNSSGNGRNSFGKGSTSSAPNLSRAVASREAAAANAAGVEFLRQGQHDEAIRQFKVALAYEPGGVLILNNIGVAHAKKQDYEGAFEWYSKAFKIDPNDIETLYSLAWVERKRQRYTNARDLFQKVLAIQPQHVGALHLLGDVFKISRDYESAARHFERLVQLDNNSVDGHLSLAQCYEHLKQYKRAADRYTTVLELAPQRFDVLFFLGRVLFLTAQYEQCVFRLDDIPDTHTLAFEARTTAAKACRELDDRSRAISNAERAAKLKKHPDVMLFLGEEYIKKGDEQMAEVWLTRALDFERDHLASLLELGQLFHRQSQWAKAELYLARLCELDCTSVLAHRTLAQCRYNQRRFDLCLLSCESALFLEPLHADTLWLLAEVHKHLGTMDLNFVLSLKTAPGQTVANGDILITLAKAYLLRKQSGDAEKWLEQAQKLLPSDRRIREALSALSKVSSASQVIDILEGDAASPGKLAVGGWAGGKDVLNSANDSAAVVDDSPAGLERLLWKAERGASSQTLRELQWRELLASARSAVTRRPRDAAALACIARALLALKGELAEIRRYVSRASDCGAESGVGFTLGYELHMYLAAASETERDMGSAEMHYREALSSRPGDEKALGALNRLLGQCSEPTQAQEVTRAGGEDTATKLRTHAQACAQAGRIDDAIITYEQVLSLRPTDVSSLMALAELDQKVGRDQEAIRRYQRALEVKPNDTQIVVSLAKLHAKRGLAGADQAIHYFKIALQTRPNRRESREITLQVADIQRSMGAMREAHQTLEAALQENLDDSEILGKLLDISNELKDAKAQRQHSRRLEQLGTLSTSQRMGYGELLLLDGQVREAREQFERVLQDDKDSVPLLLKVGACLRQDFSKENNLEEAKKVFERVVQLSPSNAEALEGAAYCERKLNNADAAILLYQACLKVKPTQEGALYYLGDMLYRQHRHAECQHYLSRLVASGCSQDYKTGGYYLLAKSCVSLDQYIDAEKHTRAGLESRPTHPNFLFMLGLIQNRTQRYDESIATLKEALKYCEGTSDEVLPLECHDWLAQAFERKREYSTALSHLDIALKRDHSHVSSLITKGHVHIQLKQFNQAESALRSALMVEKNHALAFLWLGYCRLLVSDFAEASQYFNRVLLPSLRCGTVALPRCVKGMARIYLALTLMNQEDADGALIQIAEARKSHQEFNDIATLARDVIVRGECEGLVSQLRAMSTLDVNAAQSWQLVHLLAKEMEKDLQDKGDSRASAGVASAVASSAKAASSNPPDLPLGGASALAPPVHTATTSSKPFTPVTQTSAKAQSGLKPLTPQDKGLKPLAPGPAPAAVPLGSFSQPRMSVAAAAATFLRPGQPLRLEKHELISMTDLKQAECLGSGGFGAVYRGTFNGREVAIKRLFIEDGMNLASGQLEELEREVAALRSLRHPRLLSFIGACLKPPDLCIITEYMAGGSMHHLLHKAKVVLALAQQFRMALQVSEGVDFLHSLTPPVVHRDLKSLNIVLDLEYNAKLCDFGLTQSMEKTHITVKEGGNGGSPRYMAPECYDSKGRMTEKVDVWALGCILIEAFGGPLPYDDCVNIQQIVAKILIERQAPYIPPQIPFGAAPIIESCFIFEPIKRSSAPDVYSRLKSLGP